MFLKTISGYLFQIALKNMKLLVQIWHEGSLKVKKANFYSASRVGLQQQSLSSTSPTFSISISRSCKPVFSSETDWQKNSIEEGGSEKMLALLAG